ncbi:hypothetical protein JXA40_00145 [bacterium]|nr:hypothetical protein [candidate division CSSED10-310 bacterium]
MDLSDPKSISRLLDNPSTSVEIVHALLRRERFTVEQIKRISGNKKWIQNYKLRLALVCNGKTPRYIALRFVKDLYAHDLCIVNRNMRLHPAIRELAEHFLKLRMTSMNAGDRISLAKIASGAVLRIFLKDNDLRVIRAAMGNFRLREAEVERFANEKGLTEQMYGLLLENTKWGNCQGVLKGLAINPSVGYATRRRVFEKLLMNNLIPLIRSPLLDSNHRKLARFILRDRIRRLSAEDQFIMATSHSKELLIELLAVTENEEVMLRVLNNERLNSNDVLTFLNQPLSKQVMDAIWGHERWNDHEPIQALLKRKRKTGKETTGDDPAKIEDKSES